MKPRILCFHGFRTSGQILKKLVSRWPETVLQKLDLVFIDGQFPAQGKSDVEGIFDPPYYEWFQANEDFTEYRNFEECLTYVEDYMLENGPFDGVLGFSQGAFLAAALPGMQEQSSPDIKPEKSYSSMLTLNRLGVNSPSHNQFLSRVSKALYLDTVDWRSKRSTLFLIEGAPAQPYSRLGA
ncbi:hypothetical protein KIW84_023025 [Lathyrus oleraceus]|uniref:Serine hydrolase domain-containing protein n=1 Tax=Pisum sativum TaxID=3888 RepID=A0A9D5B7E9_PEA|nr:hypothetical protein KIW84_023025 [Pisum sativum]